jgi:ABC-type uncharacterized transport system substrate-binding protein
VERVQTASDRIGRSGVEESDHRHRLLRPRRERPSRSAAEQRDELATPHSITSSARTSSVGEKDRLCRRPERRDRIPLGGWPLRSTTDAGGRLDRSLGCGDCTAAAPVAKAATASIPIVFMTGEDPVKSGLVASLNWPGANLTGVVSLNAEVGSKWIELLKELVPSATDVGLLVNPANPISKILARDAQAVSRAFGLQLHVMNAATRGELDSVFERLSKLRAATLVIGADAFLSSQSGHLTALSIRHAVPAISPYPAFARAGGLMSYGGSNTDSSRLAGVYAGRILKGQNPADLPVQQFTKVELFLNLKSAKALGMTVPLPLFGRADEVIE